MVINIDKPWVIRTYAGHSTAEASNYLYRKNLSKGQTGLSIAFDLPTQTAYDSDNILAKGEVGKVGVPISHIGNMMTLFKNIPLEKMNTSMTINAPAAWLLSLYIATAEKSGLNRKTLSGTTQNDITKTVRKAVAILVAAAVPVFQFTVPTCLTLPEDIQQPADDTNHLA